MPAELPSAKHVILPTATTGTIYTDKLFTGQRDTGLGIYDFHARFYSPKLGRFLSADSIVPNPYNPQDLNRFSYVRNNPLRYTDPSGHVIPVDSGGGGGCIVLKSCVSSVNGTTTATKTPASTPTSKPATPSQTSTINPTLSSLLTSSPTGWVTPTPGQMYVQGPTVTPTPTATATPIPKATVNPDTVAQGINTGQSGADIWQMLKTRGEVAFSSTELAVSFIVSSTAQWIADSNNGLGITEHFLRSTAVGVETLLTGVTALLVAAPIIAIGGGPEDPIADTAAVLVFLSVTNIMTYEFEKANENVIFPTISNLYH